VALAAALLSSGASWAAGEAPSVCTVDCVRLVAAFCALCTTNVRLSRAQNWQCAQDEPGELLKVRRHSGGQIEQT